VEVDTSLAHPGSTLLPGQRTKPFQELFQLSTSRIEAQTCARYLNIWRLLKVSISVIVTYIFCCPTPSLWESRW